MPGRKKNSMRWGYAGFHSHGGTLVAGWIIYLWLYISWKIPQQNPTKWMIWGYTGTPMDWKPPSEGF